MSVQISRFANVWSLNFINIGNFHPLEVVGRGSETQLPHDFFFNVSSALRVKACIAVVLNVPSKSEPIIIKLRPLVLFVILLSF